MPLPPLGGLPGMACLPARPSPPQPRALLFRSLVWATPASSGRRVRGAVAERVSAGLRQGPKVIPSKNPSGELRAESVFITVVSSVSVYAEGVRNPVATHSEGSVT